MKLIKPYKINVLAIYVPLLEYLNRKEINMPDKKQILEFIAQNRELLAREYHIQKIGLFGSYARDEATATSDIDLVVEFEKNTENIHALKMEITEIFKKQFHTNVNIASEKYIKPRVKQRILEESIFV
jgi:hypothetical protein